MKKAVVLVFLVGCFSVAGTVRADHELGPPPILEVVEFAGNVKVTLRPQCPVRRIDYRTEDQSARAGLDYQHVEGSFTSAPYEFEVPVLEDQLEEENEVVNLLISGFGAGGGPVFGGSCATSFNQSKVGRLHIYDNDGDAEALSQSSASSTGVGPSAAPTQGRAAPAVDQPVSSDNPEPVAVPLLVDETGPPVAQEKGVAEPGPSKLASILALLLLIGFGVLGFRRYRMSAPDTVVTEGDKGEVP